MLTCLVVFNMSVGTSREMVRCGGQGCGWNLGQLMMWQEQIKRWVCLWKTRSSKLEAVTDSLCL